MRRAAQILGARIVTGEDAVAQGVNDSSVIVLAVK
jgi:hypothetical protein